MNRGEYTKGELVLVYNKSLDKHFSGKGEPRWRGPYAIVARRPSGAYIVQELDGAVLKQLIAWKRLKSYVPRQGLEPAILDPKWLSPIDKLEADLIKDDSNELRTMLAHVSVGRTDLPWLSKPWLLNEEAANDCWMEWKAKEKASIVVEPPLQMAPKIEKLIEEDRQFWDFHDDILPDKHGDMPHWKNSEPRT